MAYKQIQGIYRILNLVNLKSYIGSSKNVGRRLCRHRIELRRNEHCNSYLQFSFNKYGESNFRFYLLEVFSGSPEELLDREAYWVEQYKTMNSQSGYNAIVPNNPFIYRKSMMRGTRSSKPKTRVLKKIVCINVNTGFVFETTTPEAIKDFNLRPNRVADVLSYWRGKKGALRSHRGYIIIDKDIYNPDFSYINFKRVPVYIKKIKPPKIYKPVEQWNIKRVPIIAQNKLTGEEFLFASKKECEIELNLTPGKLRRVLAASFKVRSHHGYYFKLA